MRAAVCTEHGSPELLTVVDLADPTPGLGEVVVAVAFAALNFPDLREALRAVAPDGVDVVIDPVGGPYAERALRAMRWGGRFVTVGYASGEIPRFPLNLVILKGVTIKGFEIRTFGEFAPDAAKRDEAELMALFAAGRLAPHISSVHRLDEIAAALSEVASRRSTGKVLLAM
jgi:NADPH2:quinone reductase